MNVVDLHPEELIDKLVEGKLSGGERDRLQGHLRACAECRFELAVRGDLADDAWVSGSRPRAPFPIPQGSPEGPTAEGPAPVRRTLRPTMRRALVLPLLAAALVTGGALAAVVSEVVRARHAEELLVQERSEKSAAGAPATRRAQPAPTARRSDVGEVGEEPVERPSAASSEAPPPLREVVPPAPSRGESALLGSIEPLPAARAASHVAGNRRPAAVVTNAPASADLPAIGAVSEAAGLDQGAGAASLPRRTDKNGPRTFTEAAPKTAEALFGAANRSRRYGDTAKALGLYRALQEQFPDSEEARLSRATLAALQLDRGDANAALDGFDRYIAQGGAALSVEALVGRAVALQQLGQASAELAAWREVARRFPGTIHARRAAARIAVLGSR